MARTRVRMSRGWADAIFRDPRVQADLTRRAEAIAAACNSDSAWGGYFGAGQSGSDSRPHAYVWCADGRNDEDRDNRMLHNFDAGA